MIVFFPETWPDTFGISKRSLLFSTTLTRLYALFSSCSYDSMFIDEIFSF